MPKVCAVEILRREYDEVMETYPGPGNRYGAEIYISESSRCKVCGMSPRFVVKRVWNGEVWVITISRPPVCSKVEEPTPVPA